MRGTSGEPIVMLVDGTSEAEQLAQLLLNAGVRLVRAADTIAAESLFVSSLPSLIVLSLDDEGAAAFCDLISAIPRGSGVPVILVGREDEAVRSPIESILRGEHAFLPRPVQAEQLLERLAALVGGGKAEAPPLEPLRGHRELTGVGASPAPEDDLDDTFRVLAREPTQILNESTSTSDDLLDRTFGFSMTDLLAEPPLDFGFNTDGDAGPLPWEIQLELPPPGDEDEVDADTSAAEQDGERYVETLEHPDDARRGSPLEHPAPWSPHPDSLEVRPPSAQRRPLDDRSQLPLDEERDESQDGGVTTLSADFRRVIDAVAQRLFPEASPDEYQDEHFERLRTVVPVIERTETEYEDLDEYSLEGMETFTMGHVGLTLSSLGSPAGRGERAGDDPRDEVETGEETQQRSVSKLHPAPGQPEEAPPPAALTPLTPEVLRGHRESPRSSGTPGSWTAASPLPTGEPRTRPWLDLGGERRSQGELADHPLPTLLAAAYRRGLDGQLTLRLSEATAGKLTENALPRRTLVFEAGHPVLATSSQPPDRLVERLHRQGRLTAAQAETLRAQIGASGRRAGALMIERGLIRTEELFPLIRWHFRELIHDCFSLREGTFWLEERPDLSHQRVRLEPEGPKLLLEGLRRRYRAGELEALLGGGGVRLSPSDAEEPQRCPTGLIDDEEPLVALCDGHRPLSRVLAETAVERGQALAVLYGLALLGVLRREPSSERRAAAPGQTLERAGLEQRLRLCREADYFTLLGVSPEASPYELRQAHERLSRELSPERLAAIGATDLDERLGDVRYVVDEALEVLCDDALREAYLQARFSEPRP